MTAKCKQCGKVIESSNYTIAKKRYCVGCQKKALDDALEEWKKEKEEVQDEEKQYITL